jgi:hypothetical protein
MNILEIRWLRDDRTVSFDDGVFTVNETIRVTTDLAIDPGLTVTSDPLFFIGDPLFPEIGSVHPEQNGLRFSNIGRARQMKQDKRVWEFPLIYKSNQPDSTDQGGDSNYKEDEFVDTLIAKKQWGFKSVQVPRRSSKVSDDDGATWTTYAYPTTTTAGETLLTNEDRFLPVLTYTRNELSVPTDILDIPGSVNSDSITLDGITVGPRMALISDVKISEWKRDQLYEFRTVTYTIVLKPDTWDLRLLNMGFYVKEAGQVPKRGQQFAGMLADGTTPGIPKDLVKAALLKFTPGSNADDWFNGGITRLNGDDGTGGWTSAASPADIHYRRFQHPQLLAFTAMALS